MRFALCVLLVCATQSFGQTPIRIIGPLGRVYLSATSVSRLDDGAILRNLQVAVLRKRLAYLERKSSADDPSIQVLQLQLTRLEAEVTGEATIVELKGNVEIKTDTMTLTADEADYHLATGEIEPRGHVRVVPKPK